MNNAVNTKMKNAVNKFNENGDCRKDKSKKPPKIYDNLRRELVRGWGTFTGVFEKFAEGSKDVKIHPGSSKLYGSNFFTPQGILNLNGHVIGPDKFGHFMDEGFEMFEIAVLDKEGMKKALDHSSGMENGKFGLGSSGVRSYGDMAANLGGMNFWNNILNGKKPYLSCDSKTGLYKIEKDFNWAQYVDDSWDEGINCNTFWEDDLPYNKAKSQENRKDPTNRKSVYEAYLKNLKPPLSCPANPDKCKKLSQMKCSLYVVSPTCLEVKGGNTICELDELMTIKPSGDTLESGGAGGSGSGTRSIDK